MSETIKIWNIKGVENFHKLNQNMQKKICKYQIKNRDGIFLERFVFPLNVIFFFSVFSRFSLSVTEVILEYIFISSAYRKIEQSIFNNGKLFMNNTNNKGPRFDPWGTLEARMKSFDT